MRITVIAGLALVVAACSKAEAPPAADTTPVAAAPAEPAPLTVESLAGTWNFNVMGMESDSVLTTHVLTATADPGGWSFVQPSGEKVAVRDVVAAGDSLTTAAGPFSSGVKKGARVREIHNVYRMQDGKLVGTVHARYETKGPDSVRTFRVVGTKQ